jgi:outer membrane cobalamin receptor
MSRGLLLPLLGVLAIGLRPIPASAQTPPPAAPPASPPRIEEQIVVTATAAPITLAQVPRSITVLTRADLERMGIPSLIDALRMTAAVDPRARGPRDVQTDFSIRGATFGQSLVLVDGIRLNDGQSGHHNGDIPIPAVAIDRIEVVNGAGSAVHGADALGGTINVLTRQDKHRSAEVSFGQHGYVGGQGSASLTKTGHWMAAAWGSRSRGFMFDREFAQGGAMARGEVRPGWVLDLRHQRKGFGANNFYGPSPSKEWTDQTLASVIWNRSDSEMSSEIRVTYRNHGDHFRWDIARPGFAENRHRTNVLEMVTKFRRDVGRNNHLTFGTFMGRDWVSSTNLGDRAYGRSGAYGELQMPLSERSLLQAALRLENYSTFGVAWNPSLSYNARPKEWLRVRASVGRAYRIPTFTELYYEDPANLGSEDLRPESGWSYDGGVDLVVKTWTLSATPYVRFDRNVVDWIRATPQEKWRAVNVRDVTTVGGEISATHAWKGTLIRAYHSSQLVDPTKINILSKYVLEYSRKSAGISASAIVTGIGQLAVNFDHRHRYGGQDYWLVAARASRSLTSRVRAFVEGTNLTNTVYYEIAGVDLPGRWVTAGVVVR